MASLCVCLSLFLSLYGNQKMKMIVGVMYLLSYKDFYYF